MKSYSQVDCDPHPFLSPSVPLSLPLPPLFIVEPVPLGDLGFTKGVHVMCMKAEGVAFCQVHASVVTHWSYLYFTISTVQCVTCMLHIYVYLTLLQFYVCSKAQKGMNNYV